MRPAKIIIKTNGRPSEERILKPVTRIGRHVKQDVQMYDPLMSKSHIVIEEQGGKYYLYDIGSRNGTVFNGKQIPAHQRFELKNNDEIIVGKSTIIFQYIDVPKPMISSRGRRKVTPSQIREQLRVDPHRDTIQTTKVQFRQDAQDTVFKTVSDVSRQEKFLPASEIQDIEALKHDYEKLRIAMELNQEVAGIFELNELLSKILKKAIEVFGADRGVILLQDEETQEWVPQAVWTKAGQKDTSSISISTTILNEVITQKKAILSNDAQMDARFSGAHSIMLNQIRSTMSIPMIYGDDELLGVMHLDTQLRIGLFQEKDLHLLMGFARQAAVNIKNYRLIREMEKTIVAKEQLTRLLPPSLVDQVLQGQVRLKRGGDKRIATVLFSDIRGFTSTTERSQPEAIVSMLNEYFEEMVELIFKYKGTLDKFVGDEIMAIWGAPIPVDNHAALAIQCALDMFEALQALNDKRAAQGKEPIRVGIGISTGEMIAGYMGSSKAMDYTVIGDTVNLGARLCSVAAAGEILVSEVTHTHTQTLFNFKALPPIKVKGKAAAVRSFRVFGKKS